MIEGRDNGEGGKSEDFPPKRNTVMNKTDKLSSFFGSDNFFFEGVDITIGLICL